MGKTKLSLSLSLSVSVSRSLLTWATGSLLRVAAMLRTSTWEFPFMASKMSFSVGMGMSCGDRRRDSAHFQPRLWPASRCARRPLTLMLLRLTSVRPLSLLRILSRVSSTLVQLGGSAGKILKGSALTTPARDARREGGGASARPAHTYC